MKSTTSVTDPSSPIQDRVGGEKVGANPSPPVRPTKTITIQITPQTQLQEISPTITPGVPVNVTTGTLVPANFLVIGSVLYPDNAETRARFAPTAEDIAIAQEDAARKAASLARFEAREHTGT